MINHKSVQDIHRRISEVKKIENSERGSRGRRVRQKMGAGHSSILVVDDDRDLVTILERILTEEGYKVTTAYDGNSALNLLKKYRPDLVILDIIMPNVDGFGVLDFVRQRYNIPIIVITAKRDATTLVDVIVNGADDCIRKPFSRIELLARIRAKLRRTGSLD